jgi:hypothetical protein
MRVEACVGGSVPAVLARGDRVVAVGGGLLLRPVREEERRPNGSKPILTYVKKLSEIAHTRRGHNSLLPLVV